MLYWTMLSPAMNRVSFIGLLLSMAFCCLSTVSRTLDDIAEACIVYGRPREPRAFFEFGERALMKKHLERLEKNGRIVHDGNYYRQKP